MSKLKYAALIAYKMYNTYPPIHIVHKLSVEKLRSLNVSA